MNQTNRPLIDPDPDPEADLLRALADLSAAASRITPSLPIEDLPGAIAALQAPLIAARLAISKATNPHA